MKGLLIASQDREAREQLASRFDPDIYQVTTADCVANALEEIVNNEIQVVVLDGPCNEKNVAKLVPLLKKCNRHLGIVLSSEELPLELLKRIRQEGIFYHALRNAGEDNSEEIYQAVTYAFKKSQQTHYPGKEKTMLSIKSLLSSLLVSLIVVTPVFAVDTTTTYNSGILVLLFIGFCALLIVAQLVPAVLVLFGMTKAVAKGFSKKPAANSTAD